MRRKAWLLPISAVVLVLGMGTAGAQRNGGGSGSGSGAGSGSGNSGNTTRTPNFPAATSDPFSAIDKTNVGADPNTVLQEHHRELALMNERQKKILDDTAKLLRLAQELKDSVDKTTKDTLSLEVIKKAEEIEKLARDVKQRMKS